MRITKISSAYLREEITRDCYYCHYVEFREEEIGTPKFVDLSLTGDAIVGIDPLDADKWVCLAINGKLAWSKGFKTIKSAIKNAYLL